MSEGKNIPVKLFTHGHTVLRHSYKMFLPLHAVSGCSENSSLVLLSHTFRIWTKICLSQFQNLLRNILNTDWIIDIWTHTESCALK